MAARSRTRGPVAEKAVDAKDVGDDVVEAEAPAEEPPAPAVVSPISGVAEEFEEAVFKAQPSDEVSFDYVGLAQELTAVVEKEAGVTANDTEEKRTEKIHEWNANGGLLEAIEGGKFDTKSSVLGGSLKDALGETPIQFRGVTALGPDDVIVDAEATSVSVFGNLHYVPTPNQDPWGPGVKAHVNDLVVAWDGVSWVTL